MSDKTKEHEELKRERAYDPVQRWKHIQETIAWAEANLPPELRRNRPGVRLAPSLQLGMAGTTNELMGVKSKR